MKSTPRYVRFARCLALVSGLGACGSSAPTSTTTSSTTTTSTSSGSIVNRPTSMAQCDCTCGSATHAQPSCYDVGMGDCCQPVEGPLPPPDLAV